MRHNVNRFLVVVARWALKHIQIEKAGMDNRYPSLVFNVGVVGSMSAAKGAYVSHISFTTAGR